MNDIILSGLLNLFALCGAEGKTDKQRSQNLVEEHLKGFFGVRNPQSYLNLYADLREYYDDFPEMDHGTITDGICSQLKSRIGREEQETLLLRLMEFCAVLSVTGAGQSVFRRVAQCFDIDDALYASFEDFIAGREGADVRCFALGAGTVKTLLMPHSRTLIFTYDGPGAAMLNDIPVVRGLFYIFQPSAVFKGRDFSPLYHSALMERYGDASHGTPITLCGRDINFRFEKGADNGMHNFSFTLRSGELVAIMGGSGVGKSTLLSLLNGTLRPQEGSITVNGHDIAGPEAKALIGYVPQDDLLVEELTVYQNLWYTARLCFSTLDDAALDRKVISVLEQLGLDAARDLKVGSPINKFISGGQRKRLNIALELIREPAILFLDEPTSGLSSSDTEKVINLLKEQTGKGRLIVVNIHQPSSDVYKLFDRLWLLDKGGYPVFDGNPIDAVGWFKSAAGYADVTSACPVCGNVNPEVMLSIIDEKTLDTSGHPTAERKVSPQGWHELYLKARPEMSAPEPADIPPTDQRRPGLVKQISIFLSRNLRAKLTNLQYILVTLLEAPLLALVCGLLTHYAPDGGMYTVMENKNLVSYFFMAIIVAIFLGMSGSAEEIIRDRALLKREKFLSLSYPAYIWSKILFAAAVCAVQTLLFIVVGNALMGIHFNFAMWWGILFLAAFLSSLIGLILSQCMSSVVAIYITIPLLLIPQILLCGLVVRFDDLNPGSETGNVPVIGEVIPSRWAFEALAVSSFSDNPYEKPFYEGDREKFVCQYYEHVFLHELESQLESREFERGQGVEEKPQHMAVLRAELPHLAQICEIGPYEGDESYASLSAYLARAKKVLSSRGNHATLALDRQVGAFVREYGKETLRDLKRDSYNIQLENLVLGRDAERRCSVVGSHIVPRCGAIFLPPRSTCGRAPFYSGVKRLGELEIPTPLFDIAVLILMCLIAACCLFVNFPEFFLNLRRIVRNK
ncbi:MAG: ATP-binding cassette domain-containing protein [Bacteroidales bacterium]|nr:ATP-binding cassette domain-containing protein [Bacteroidales bacterium]